MQQRKYEFEHLSYRDLKSNITVPQFQRSLVWSKSQKDQFIQTVREGKPFGSILVYKSMEKYEIIDGLQRFTTLRNYEENPAEYIDITSDNFPQITEIASIIKSIIPSTQSERLERHIVDCIKTTLKTISLNDDLLVRTIRDSIVDYYGDAIPRQSCNAIEDKIFLMAKIWRTDIMMKRTTQQIINEVNATMAMSDMPLTDEDKDRIERLLTNQITVADAIDEITQKYKR